MKSARFLPLLASAMLLAGCDDEGDVIIAPPANLAYTRFVHAVSDTGATDWRFIDQLEYSPIGLALTFRTFSPYQATEAGSRHLRVFPRSTDINLTQQHLIDATINLEAGRYYTLVHVGLARAGSTPEDQLLVIQDDIPGTIATTDVAVRAMNLGTGLANPDVYALATPTTAIAGAPIFSNIAFNSVTAYLTRATGAFALHGVPTGQTTPVIAAATAPPGSAADAGNNLTAIGGTGIGGSAILGIYIPGSVVGSSAPQTSAFVVQTGVSMAVTPLGYHRASGNFAGIAGDGWAVGNTVTASGFSNAANNGTSTVSGFTPSRTTGSTSLAADGTTETFVRTAGSFLTDGFTADMWVTVSGFPTGSANNGRARVTAVTALTLTVAKDLVTEAAAASRTAVSDLIINVTKAPALVDESAGSSRLLLGPPRPAWVYIIDKHPR